MGILNKFKKREKQEESTNLEGGQATATTELEQLCGNDKETYEALIHTMFLDPRKIETSSKEAAENARKFEKAKDFVRARAWYEVAGGLAIYEGNAKRVVEFFTECGRISPDRKYPILKNPEKAVAKAKEYYKKHLKA